MKTRGQKSLWSTFILLFLIAPGFVFAFQPANSKSDLQQKEFFLPELSIGNKALSFANVSNTLANKGAIDAFVAQYGSGAIHIDPRSGAVMSMTAVIPLIPGKGMGNNLTIQSISGTLGRSVDAVNSDVVADLFRDFLIKNQAALGIDANQLGPVRAVKINDRLWNVNIQQAVNEIPVRWGRYVAVINGGNIILQGAATWGNVKTDTTPRISAQQAKELGFKYVGGQLSKDLIWKKPTLELIPTSAKDYNLESGAIGSGYGHRLAYVFGFQRAPENARWEILVDAHTAEVLSMEDKNHYIDKTIKGGVYPLTNTEICPDNIRCGILQSNTPMPYTNTGFAAPNNFTNSAGVFDYTSGTTTTSLSGPYVVLNDTCGAISESGAGDINLGGTNGDHDCDTPTSGGNTAASRSGMYEVNKIFEAGRGYLPSNPWLQGNQGGPLPTNMNINDSCNAFYTFGDPGTINFYRELGGCRNTGEIAAVFDHEWGHGMDEHDSGGGFSNSSEGYADIASMYRLMASCVGYGFFTTALAPGIGCGLTADGTGANQDEAQTGAAVCDLDCSGVRDADYTKIAGGNPLTATFVCAQCGGGGGPCGRQVHCSATPTREAAWNFVARELQNPPGVDVDNNTAFIIGDKVFYQGSGNVGTWHNCTCPTTSDGCNADGGYLNWLAADDDDGNLNNGTPHMLDIHAAFNTNGIACAAPAPTNAGCAGGPTAAPVVTGSPGSNAATLNWGAVPNAVQYNVYRTEGYVTDGADKCAFGKALVETTNTLSFTDPDVANGRAYSYVVMAEGTNDACFGPASNCTTVTPQPCAGSVTLDSPAYSCSDTININLVDSDLIGAGTQNVSISAGIDDETVTLTETPASSGIFVGSINTSGSGGSSGDGTLNVNDGQTIVVLYQDASFCGPPQDVTATATADCLAVLEHTTASFTDSCGTGGPGHDDGILDPGETAQLQVTAQNVSITDATGVSGTLSTTTPGVTITDNTATFADIPAGGSSPSDAPHFSFVVDTSVTCGTFIDFTINYTTDQGTSSDSFTLMVGEPTFSTTTYVSTDVPKNIVDGATTTSVLTIPDNVAISDINVTLSLTHTWDGDLDISLIGPGGSPIVDLTSDNGGSGDNYTNTTFDDEAATPITSGTPPFTGTFSPEGSLSAFDGLLSGGTWTLQIVDDFLADVGILQSWSISATLATGVACNNCVGGCPAITLSPATLPDAVVNSPYNQTITAVGGTPPYTFAVTSGALPQGLTLAADGSLTGTPTQVEVANFTITATDSSACTGSLAYTITVTTCLFCDEFSDGIVDPNWTYLRNILPWVEAADALSATPLRQTQAHAIPVFGGCTNCYAETIMRSAGGAFSKIFFLFHVVDKFNLVELQMNDSKNRWVAKHRINKTVVSKQKFLAPIEPNTDYTVRIRYDGTNFIVSIDGVDQITFAPGGTVTGGSVGFKVKRTTGTFQRIEVN